MQERITLGSRGTVQIPTPMLEKLGLWAGDPLTIEDGSGGLFLRPAVGDPPRPTCTSTDPPPPTVDLIVIGGSPGSGKSTLCRNLKRRWEAAPWINFGALRAFHLDPAWTRANDDEEAMAFDHLVYVARSYVKHGHRPVIVEDLLDHRLTGAGRAFAGLDYRVLTLVARDGVIAARVRNRGEGWKDVDGAVEWNREVRERAAITHESKLDTSDLDAAGVAEAAVRLLTRASA